jgi:ABC-2 type transport system ATP-binding protein
VVGRRRHGRARDEVGASPGPVIEARELGKDFGDQVAVVDLDLVVPPGSILGLIGPSGCGKTTTVRMLAGITDPTSGHLRVLGREPRHFRVRDRARIGYMPQLPVLYPELTLWENLQFTASLYGVKLRHRRRLLEEMLELVDLAEHKRKRLRDASGGMQRRLSLAATLVHGPDLIYLDEPTAGIDPILRERFWEHFRSLRDQGRTLVVTTQYVGEAVHCDFVGVMTDARLVYLDTPEGLRRHAFGTEFVDVHLEDEVDRTTIAALRASPVVVGPPRRESDHVVRLPVADASQAIPELVAWCGTRDLGLQGIEPFVPEYDEVFVEVVQRARTERDAAVPDAGTDPPAEPTGPPLGPTGPPPGPGLPPSPSPGPSAPTPGSWS